MSLSSDKGLSLLNPLRVTNGMLFSLQYDAALTIFLEVPLLLIKIRISFLLVYAFIASETQSHYALHFCNNYLIE